MPQVWRAAEFFAGIGGFAAAWPEVSISVAIDINLNAADCYRKNFRHPYWTREIESLSFQQLTDLDTNLWWLSPPCQPYSRRGNRRGHLDPRAKSLLHLIESIQFCRPHAIALENVVGFEQSEAYRELRRTLEQHAYHVLERRLCPSEMGWPNYRPRFYLLACQAKLPGWQELPDYALTLRDIFTNPVQVDDLNLLRVPDSERGQWEDAMHRVSYLDTHPTACFASSYGKSIVRSGSYLVQDSEMRRFAPSEVARLLGFPDSFVIAPRSCNAEDGSSQQAYRHFRHQWRLLGNSLSLPAVRYVLSHLHHGPSMRIPWWDH